MKRTRVALIKGKGCLLCDSGIERWREEGVHLGRVVWVHVVWGDCLCAIQRDAPEHIADVVD